MYAPKRDLRWRVLVLRALSEDWLSIEDVREYKEKRNAEAAQKELAEANPGLTVVLQVGMLEWFAQDSREFEDRIGPFVDRMNEFGFQDGWVDPKRWYEDEQEYQRTKKAAERGLEPQKEGT